MKNYIQKIDSIMETNPEKLLIKKEIYEFLHDLIEKLPEKEKIVAKMRFIQEISLEEIGKCINITKQGVQHIEAKILRKFRKFRIKDEIFKNYFDDF